MVELVKVLMLGYKVVHWREAGGLHIRVKLYPTESQGMHYITLYI